MANAKTLRKRIALVAATALGVGLLVAAPASATNSSLPASTVNSISLATYTAAPTVGSSLVVNAGATLASTTTGTGDYVKFVGYLSSYPSGGFAQVSAATTLGSGTAVPNTGFTTSPSGSSLTETAGAATNAASTVTASTNTGIGSFSFTPPVAGTYTLTVWNDADGNGVVNIGEAVQTVSVTIGAATTSGYSSGLSTAVVNLGLSSGAPTDVPINASKSAGQVANVAITLKKADTNPMIGETVSAVISGSGLIAFNNAGPSANGTARAASSTLTGTNVTYIGVSADGTAGPSTLTISVTDTATGITTVLATKTFTFYGPVASLKAVQNNSVIGSGGATSGTNSGTANNSTFALTPAVVVTALDANGIAISNVAGSISGLSSDLTVLQSVTTLGEDTNGVNGGAGHYNSAITSNAGSVSGKSATLTFRYTTDGVNFISAAPLNFTIGGTIPATVTIGLDKATYVPGAKATLTITAKDSAGNPVADGLYANLFSAAGVTSSAAVQGTLPGASVTFNKGVSTSTLYAPVSPVAFTISGTLGASVATVAQGTVVSATATVTGTTVDPGTAANATAIAALQATVATLATTIASLVAAITAQIAALSALIKKAMATKVIKASR